MPMTEKDSPTFDAETTKPEPYTALRLYFPDGSRKGGIWTGEQWWSEGHAVHPVRWQRLPGPEPGRKNR
jgi:hypothetical protein